MTVEWQNAGRQPWAAPRAEDPTGRALREHMVLERVRFDLRRSSFREWLGATVTEVSALVPELVREAGLDRAAAMRKLSPLQDWPAGRRWRRGRWTRHEHEGPAGAFGTRADGNALLLRPWSGTEQVVLEVVGRAIEVAVDAKTFRFRTREGRGILRLPGVLPDATMTACIDRSLDDIVETARLNGRGFVVSEVAIRQAETFVVFPVDRLPIWSWEDEPGG